MKRELERIGWQADFFETEKPSDAAGFPSVGARGCFESHLAVLRRNRGVDRLVVLEDDVNFARDFGHLWSEAERELERVDWSICYLGHQLPVEKFGLILLDSSQAVRCSHFLMFNGLSLAQIIAELEVIYSRPPGHPDGGPMHVDGAYSTIRAQRPHLKTYAYVPSLGYQRSSRTDIADDKWFDRSSVLRPLVDLARRAKDAFRH
ncbi:MAG: LPS biosynthesis glycosyltransferase [Bradyrhizobium sp.]|nr:hypothetical protein [Bradyrhizobium sp.]MBI5263394.1 LPS biosynthesis glycosyltransferase [Bradyrhizobium sp.]